MVNYNYKQSPSAFRHETHRTSLEMRDTLIDHIDGATVPFGGTARRIRALRALALHKLIAPDVQGTPTWNSSTITDKGRRELGALLADYADALLRVGVNDKLRSLGIPLSDCDGPEDLACVAWGANMARSESLYADVSTQDD